MYVQAIVSVCLSVTESPFWADFVNKYLNNGDGILVSADHGFGRMWLFVCHLERLSIPMQLVTRSTHQFDSPIPKVSH